MSEAQYEVVDPNPRALAESVRSVGYSLPTAIADILDNSVTARAGTIWLDFWWQGHESWIAILDDGSGMEESKLREAMRPGTTSPTDLRDKDDLGRFGLGLKTASFSQCRKLGVWSKTVSSGLFGREWDLDLVVRENKWLLNKAPKDPETKLFKLLDTSEHGTLVVWSNLERVVQNAKSNDDDGQKRFYENVKVVQRYLEMIFHRHLEGSASTPGPPLKILINGNSIRPWNPFQIPGGAVVVDTPVESIPYFGKLVSVRGFVMPHKDKLNEEQLERGAGPMGWLGQQGFYLYRNDRIILPGDWLGLTRGSRPWAKEEQYKLARLSIDIGNSMDLDWSLDVKKSSATPPATLRPRLTGLAENVRKMAKEVFVHRGFYGPRTRTPAINPERPWTSGSRQGRTVYRINREHPLIRGTIQRLGPLSRLVESVFRLVEETVPVEKIWVDVAESNIDHATPYEGLPDAQIASDLRKTFEYLMESGLNRPSAIAYLLASEPFNRYPGLVKTLKE